MTEDRTGVLSATALDEAEHEGVSVGLASMLGTLFGTAVVPNPDGVSLRPDFLILVYPITSFASGRVNNDVRDSLLGEHPTAELVTKFSSELQVTDSTPPTLLLAASDEGLPDGQLSTADWLSRFTRNEAVHGIFRAMWSSGVSAYRRCPCRDR